MISRRAFLALAGSWLASACFEAAPRRAGPPDVLFLSFDDLAPWVPPFGGYAGPLHLPNFERLAARATAFTNAQAQGVSCKCSRASALTGLWPETVGILGEEGVGELRDFAPDVTTLPAHFRANGYRALGYGKVLHQPDPISWDHEEFFWHDPDPPRRPLSGVAFPYYFDWGAIDLPASFMGDHRKAAAALEAWRAPREQPLFRGRGIVKPHTPWIVPRDYFERIAPASVVMPEAPPDDLDDIPAFAREHIPGVGYQKRLDEYHAARSALRAYLACVSYCDDLLGMVLDELDRQRAWDHTILVVWSDHGLHFGEKGRWQKFTLWEESTRVPLLVHAPGVSQAGARCTRPVGLIDLFPTLAELCGLPPAPDLAGESLVPLLRDPGAPRTRPAFTTWIHSHAVRSERWRYIRYQDGSEELYDHEADPHEWRNLAAAPGDAAAKAELAGWLDRHLAGLAGAHRAATSGG
jgi:arylsulfatase A-like enzyme